MSNESGLAAPASAGAPSQTQPEVNSLLNGIFDDFGDDDDDVAVPSINKVVDSNLIDSDDEEAQPTPQPREKKHKLTKHKTSAKHSKGSEKSKTGARSDKATADDNAFIDSDDEDNAGVMREYKADKQYTDYEDYEQASSAKKRKTDGDGSSRASKGDDPLSKTLDAMQAAKKKQKELNDEQKAQMATNIMQLMDKAYKDDEILREQGKPAVNKLMLLTQVQHVCNLKPVQFSLLEYDILTSINMWISPIDHGKGLPALSLRVPMYDILLNLPCQVDHLKKSNIGKTIVALRGHKLETVENKKILKAIMEKWCRPIFNKSADVRNTYQQKISQVEHDLARSRQEAKIQQLNEAAKDKRANPYNTMLPAKNQAAVAVSASAEESGFDGEDGGAGAANPLAAAIDGEGDVANGAQRVRMPYNTGFYFTVRPENKVSREQAQRSRVAEEDLEIDTETGAVIGRSRGSGGSSKSQVPDTYQNRLSKQIKELNKQSGVMGLGIKKPFKLQLK